MKNTKQLVTDLLAKADIKIDGNRPWDIKVYNESFYSRLMSKGSLGLGESYMDGWWDCESLDQFFDKLISARLTDKVKFTLPTIVNYLKSVFFNLQTKARAFEVGEKHYDAGNDLYKKMLDKRLVYTCAYWKDAKNLDEAQDAKLDLICKKIGLKPGDRVLDIGCGWGSFLKFAAEKYGVSGVGVTISKEQKVLADELCKGLPVEIRLQDYRDVNEKFDHVISIGMFEHVGVKNYNEYMKVANRVLKNDGLFLLHTIGSNTSTPDTDPWIDKYIFPNGMLPSIAQISKSLEGYFVLEDWHNFGAYYDKTLMAWFENFYEHWDEIKSNYSEKFYRMWKYYLLCCAGSFRARNIQLWQIVLSKKGVRGGYQSVR